MGTEMGEYVVGAYLEKVEGCELISYNVRLKGGGKKGLNEIDVIGINFKKKSVYLCEVTTHMKGLLYKSTKETVKRIGRKYKWMKEFSEQFRLERKYLFWSPYVPKGKITEGLASFDGLECIINDEYTKRIGKLKGRARKDVSPTNNPFYRAIQILENLR